MSLFLKTLKTQKFSKPVSRAASQHFQQGSHEFHTSSRQSTDQSNHSQENYYGPQENPHFRHGWKYRNENLHELPYASGWQYYFPETDDFEDDEPVTEERLYYYGEDPYGVFDEERIDPPIELPTEIIDPVLNEPFADDEPLQSQEEPDIMAASISQTQGVKDTSVGVLATPIHLYHEQLARLADQVKDATCTIRVYDARARSVAHGSGCFIESSGVIVTAAHVVGTARSVAIVTRQNPDQFMRATVRTVDQFSDIAILEVNKPRAEADPKPYNFPTVKLAPRDYAAKEGDFCLLVGAPQSLKYHSTVSTGVINHAPRKLGDLQEKIVIQHDAMCGGGTSGGALMNANGEMIGVHILRNASRRSGGSNFGFAAPLSELYYLYDSFKAATCKYELGVSYVEAKDDTHGEHLVVTLSTNSGFKKGDMILGFAEENSGTYNSLAGAIRKRVLSGESMSLHVIREVTEKDGKKARRKGVLKLSPQRKSKKL